MSSVVEMIVILQNIVSIGEAMYQSAFVSLKFCLNSVEISFVAEHKFKKIVKSSSLTLI